MTLITSQASLNIGTELIIDEANRTWELVATGNLVAKDGVNLQAVYSKMVSLWNTVDYNDSPMPMRAGNVKAGNYIFGQDDSGDYNGFKPKNQSTINMLRNGGFLQYDQNGNLTQVWSCWVGLGTINQGATPYYVLDDGESPQNFPFDDQPNVPIQVYGDASNGDFDFRNGSPKLFVREQAQLFTSSTLSDAGSTLGGDIARFLLNNRLDDNVVANDSQIQNDEPYSGMSYTRYSEDQVRNLGGSDYGFRRIIDANGGTIEQAYTYAQYLLRQGADIDTSGSVEVGRTADDFGVFNGSDFVGAQSVYFDNLASSSTSQMRLTDEAGTSNIRFPSISAGFLRFTSNLSEGGQGTYALFYETPPEGSPFGTGSGQVLVEDQNGDPIQGNITSESIPFDFAFSQNTQAGFSAGTQRDVVLVGINPGFGKYQKLAATIIESTTLSFSLVAQDDTAHEDFAA